MRLKAKIAVITGASKGLGRSIAMAFAREGSDLILAARSKDQLENLAEEIKQFGSKVISVPCDVSSSDDVYKLTEFVGDTFGQVDILVNNAGISSRSKILEYDDETWLHVIKVNLFGNYLCTKAILPLIQKTGKGRIINMASIAGKNPLPFNTAYSASKHAILGFTKSVASEVALSGYPGITVNAICPFFTKTEMYSRYLDEASKREGVDKNTINEKTLSTTLQKRVLEPEEIANLAIYLASDDARGITGQAINICGGRIFH